MTQPSRLAFWRIILGIIPPAALLSLWQILNLANKLGIASLTSKSWLAALGTLAAIALLSLLLLILTWSPRREALLDSLEICSRIKNPYRWLGLPVLFIALTAFSLSIFPGYYTDLLRTQDWVRLFIFLLLALLGMNALKLLKPAFSWPAAFSISILLQAVVYRLASTLPEISTYPFAMGWSEVTRFYLPSLFISKSVYGQSFAWPIINPSLHILLIPPYLIDAPLWAHRAWQAALRVGLVALVAPALISRLKIPSQAMRWVFGSWVFLYLFQGPLYFHLALPVILVLYGFSISDQRRTWLVILLASVWCGLSRINWFPLPAMLAAVLYFLETPLAGKNFWRYLFRPALWSIVGFMVAFVSQRVYIALSGVRDPDLFFTSIGSNLLSYRLWPNASFILGVLPGIILASFLLWLVIYLFLRQSRTAIHPWRLAFIGAPILVFLAGGVVVSMKIGGGADLHNMDAYMLLLLIFFAYPVFGSHASENELPVRPMTIPWQVVALLMIIPVWFVLRFTPEFMQYKPPQSQATLTALQQRVDTVQAQGGEILFITQRQLISLHMLKGVTLVPEYEREELMEMAISNYGKYLDRFHADISNRRFAMIIVDALQINYLGSDYFMGEENNAWDGRVAKPILCSYQPDAIFIEDHIVIYVPQQGTPHCP